MKENSSPDINPVFDTFIANIKEYTLSSLSADEEFPNEADRAKRIKDLAKTSCSFGFLISPITTVITPVEGLNFPFSGENITAYDFCKYIHPAYLIPFLVTAQFTYDVLAQTKPARNTLFNACQKVPIPLKLTAGSDYMWYVQNAHAVSVNRCNQLLSHLNLYTLERPCLELPNGDIENRYIEASFVSENNLIDLLHSHIKISMKKIIDSSFQNQYKKKKLLQLLKEDIHISNKKIADMLRLSEETIKSYNKDILQKLKMLMGYQFVSLREAVATLSFKGYL